jgi:peroxiredoxin
MALAVGALAPDFELENQHRRKVRLSGFRGHRHVVLAFHPLAFTPV